MPFFQPILLQLADITGVAKFDLNSLDQQARMELFVADIKDTHRFRDLEGDYYDVCKWLSVMCDADKAVKQICFYGVFQPFFPQGGTVNLDVLPETLTNCLLKGNKLEGTCNTAKLPRTLTSLDLSSNKMSGTFDIAGLPPKMCQIIIEDNKFSGVLAIGHLPPETKRFSARFNDFGGALDLSTLPRNLWTLHLDKSKFDADFSLVPEYVEGIHEQDYGALLMEGLKMPNESGHLMGPTLTDTRGLNFE